MNLNALAQLNLTLRGVASRKEKVSQIARLVRALDAQEIEIAIAFLCGEVRQPKLGVGPSAVHSIEVAPALESTLSLTEVDAIFAHLARISGKGAKSARLQTLASLFSQATIVEQVYLRDLLLAELRQGALDGLVIEAIAEALGIAPETLRRAVLLSGSLRDVAQAALQGGTARVSAIFLQLFRPVQPMLAQPSADGVVSAARLDEPVWEYKLDGARVQIHREGERVEVYTRNLNVVTESVPELVEFALALPCHSVVLDGEALALRADRSPHPFQVTMRRFGRSTNVEQERQVLPLMPMIFDCLYLDGRVLLDQPLLERHQALDGIVPLPFVVERCKTGSAEEGLAFFQRALAAGHEGVVVKSGRSPYVAGRRGGEWLKIKQVHTLDLVVIAAEWGSGRRKGKLSNLHLSARGEKEGQFVMLGKTFKGMTDELLEWQTRELLARQVGRQGHVVWVRPELVVEVAFDGILESPQYPAQMALRFARIRGYRHDKSAEEADTLVTVRALFDQERARGRIFTEED